MAFPSEYGERRDTPTGAPKREAEQHNPENPERVCSASYVSEQIMAAIQVREDNRLTTLDAAAAYLGIHPRTIRRRVAEGEIQAFRIAGTRAIRVRVADLDAMLIPAITGRRDA